MGTIEDKTVEANPKLNKLQQRYGTEHSYDDLTPLQKSFLFHPETYDRSSFYFQIKVKNISLEDEQPKLLIVDESSVLKRATRLNGYVDQRLEFYAEAINLDKESIKEVNSNNGTYFRMEKNGSIIDIIFSRDKL